MKKTKTSRIVICVMVIAILIGVEWFRSKPFSPEGQFQELFAGLSVGLPEYETFELFSQPEDSTEGDSFTAEIRQNPAQLEKFAARLNTPLPDLLTPFGVGNIKVFPGAKSEFPWFLQVKAELLTATNQVYKVYISGEQPLE